MSDVIDDVVAAVARASLADVDSLSFAFDKIDSENLAQLCLVPLPVDKKEGTPKRIDDRHKKSQRGVVVFPNKVSSNLNRD